MEFLAEYGLFFAKVATILVAMLVFFGFLFANAQRGRVQADGQIEVKSLNDRLEDLSQGLANSLLDPAAQKIAKRSSFYSPGVLEFIKKHVNLTSWGP